MKSGVLNGWLAVLAGVSSLHAAGGTDLLSDPQVLAACLQSTGTVSPACKDAQAGLGACGRDIQRLCPGARDPFSAGECVQAHPGEFSAECRPYLNVGKEKGTLWGECGEAMRDFCGDVQPGGFRLLECLRRNKDKVTPSCRQEIDKLARYQTADDQKEKYDQAVEKARSSIPGLIQSLASPDVSARRDASSQLANMGPIAQEAAPALVKALGDSDKTVRTSAAMALGACEVRSAGVIGALSRALSDPDVQVRWAAAMSLGKIGPAAKPALPALQKISMTDGEPNLRRVAAEAAEKIGR